MHTLPFNSHLGQAVGRWAPGRRGITGGAGPGTWRAGRRQRLATADMEPYFAQIPVPGTPGPLGVWPWREHSVCSYCGQTSARSPSPLPSGSQAGDTVARPAPRPGAARARGQRRRPWLGPGSDGPHGPRPQHTGRPRPSLGSGPQTGLELHRPSGIVGAAPSGPEPHTSIKTERLVSLPLGPHCSGPHPDVFRVPPTPAQVVHTLLGPLPRSHRRRGRIPRKEKISLPHHKNKLLVFVLRLDVK